MQKKNWNKVKALLQEALELEPSEREKFLDRADLTGDMREEIESLLAFEKEAEELMDLSAVEYSRDFFDLDADEKNILIGQKIGAYEIVRELGYGGMGAVYLAARSDGKFKQNVALKLLKREMNTSALRRRFQQEREILASLEHPNIARLLDAGTTGDQIPFIAMEYVEGLPIDEYCSNNNLDLTDRLNLFRTVCAAVDFAHRNLIVHRDLKPSNILVNGNGIPKLLDFGISKILSAKLEQLNSATVTKIGIMTPGYASPEQLQSKSVTTATDIYSLGVILYELLSGHRPFEKKETNFKEIYRAVLEETPVPPSAMLSGASFLNSSFAAKRSFPSKLTVNQKQNTTPPNIIRNPQLKGDLDNIVLKALRKEPERRYTSAENFAEDLHRHQQGLPVTALPNTFAYRAEKFFKRNKATAIAGFFVFFAVAGGIAATLWQAHAARVERVKAEKRFNDVRALANSFLFEFSPRIENLPGSIPARRLLVTRALEYLDNLSLESRRDAALQSELATAYEKVGDIQGNPFNPNIGDTKGALESYEKAEKIRQNILEKKPDDAPSLDALAHNFKLQGSLHSQGGNYKRAGELFTKALEIQEKVVQKDPQNSNFRWNLADIVRYNGFIAYTNEQHKSAVQLYARAIEIYEQIVPEQLENIRLAENYANVFVSMGESQGWDNDFKGGGINLQKGLDMLLQLRKKDPNDRHLQRSLVIAYGKRGENLVDLEEYDKAQEYYLKSIELAKNILDADPQDKQAKRDIALQYKKRATAFNAMDKIEQGIENMTVALKIFQELADADPNNTENLYDIANARRVIGLNYLTLRQYKKALDFSLTAAEEYETALQMNPHKDYIKVGRAFAFKSIGRSYLGLAEKGNARENLQKAADNLQIALDELKVVNDAGRLNQSDVPNLENLGKQILEIKSKLGNIAE